MNMSIVFFGTPDFAVATLKKLVENNLIIQAVVTMPDKPAGRGMNLQMSPIKVYAVEQNIPILQPPNLKDELFLKELKAIRADLFIVVAFRMLPEVVWNMPPFGTINLHASLLPQYRGAAPINWAIINGEKITGVTTFKLQHQIDTGNVLLQEEVKIEAYDNAGTLHDKLMTVGANLVLQTVEKLFDHSIVEIPQLNISSLKSAPKIFKETCKIFWNQNAEPIHNFIRGLSPYPGAFTFLGNKKLKIFSSEIELAEHDFSEGKIISDHKSFLKFACKDGFVHVLELQLEGKKRMWVQDFLRGYVFEDN